VFFYNSRVIDKVFKEQLTENTMVRPSDFKDPEYDRQLAEFKARKAEMLRLRGDKPKSNIDRTSERPKLDAPKTNERPKFSLNMDR
jgi:hypothetical protein